MVSDIIQDLLSAGAKRVLCNCLGLSRGGLALMILAQQLSALPADQTQRIDLNLCLFDPVPGRLVATGFPFTHQFSKVLYFVAYVVHALTFENFRQGSHS